METSDYAFKHGDAVAAAAPSSALTNRRQAAYWIILAVLVLLTVADGVLVVVLFDLYTEEFAQFVNQGTAFVYIIASSAILFVRWLPCCRTCRCFWDKPKDEIAATAPDGTKIPTAPWYLLVGIGLFNGSGNFLMAIAQPHTPGLTQSLLMLLGIPLVMVLSAVFLRKCPSWMAVAGAASIVIGCSASALRAVFDPDPGPVTVLWYSVFCFALAQIFLSAEKVWEEGSFSKFATLDPMLMFWYTLVTQFLLGWGLYPLQTFPDFGNITLAEIPMVIVNGTLCTLGESVPTSVAGSPCSLSNTLIFFVYCSVDFWCYFFGLFVIQRGGANLMVMASAISLPLQQLVLCTPFLMAALVETFFWGDAVALALVLAGFGVYQFLSREGRAERGVPPLQLCGDRGLPARSATTTTGAVLEDPLMSE